MSDNTPSNPQTAWPALTPLPKPGDIPLPPFPVGALPGALREMAAGVAQATQTPIELAAMMGLSTISAASGRARVRVHAFWEEPTNTYTAVAMDPGSRKSPVVKLVVGPLHAYEKDKEKRGARAYAKAEAQMEVLEKRKRKAQDRALDDDATFNELDAIVEKICDFEMPPKAQLLADDATPEALATIMGRNGGALGVLSAEGGLFDVFEGRFSSGGQPPVDVYLQSYSGEALKRDRVGSGRSVVDDPCLTIGLAVQPIVLRRAAANEWLLGRGLLDRFFFLFPTSTMGSRDMDPALLTENAFYNWHELVTNLALSREKAGPIVTLTLDEAARREHLAFARMLEPLRSADGELGGRIQGWASKLDGGVLRIAGLLHLAEVGSFHDVRPIGRSTMCAAIEIGRYLIPHAKLTFRMIEGAAIVAGAKVIIAWVRRKKLSDFKQRDCQRELSSTFENEAALRPSLEQLADLGWLRHERQPTGGRPSDIWHVNPAVHASRLKLVA